MEQQAKQDSKEEGKRESQQLSSSKSSSDWKEKVIQIRRVTKVVKGGKKLSFRAVVVVGNKDGLVGVGTGKSSEVIGAIQKAVVEARKNLITVPRYGSTIPHPISGNFGAGKVTLKPAPEGTGIKAGGAPRIVLELAGIDNISCKSLGSDSPLNGANSTIKCLSKLRTFKNVADIRGLSVKEMIM